jgi:hypothetical protein
MLFAIEDIRNRLEQIGTAGLPRNIARGTELQGTGGVLGIWVRTEDEYRSLRADGAEFPQDLEAIILVGKVGIENHEAPRLCLDLSQGFFGAFRLAKDDVSELVTKHLLQTQTNERIIIDDQYR